MRFGFATAVAALTLGVGAGSAFSQQACLTREEAVAVKARVMQTELMVATLSCVRAVDQSSKYNAFMERHSAELQRHNRVIQQHFARVGGGNPQRRYDTFTTALANDASNRSMANPTFCHDTTALFDSIVRIERGKLADAVEERARHTPQRFGELCGRDPAMQYALAR
ncbi:MAG: hypothetical protein JNL71_02135 [Rhodospirillales bacterium]|nr:hypothetical protein [Rhodospirillales bacterium]